MSCVSVTCLCMCVCWERAAHILSFASSLSLERFCNFTALTVPTDGACAHGCMILGECMLHLACMRGMRTWMSSRMRYSASGARAFAASGESLLMSSECAMSSMVAGLMKDMLMK